MAYFNTFFAETIANPTKHGIVHIMVVNTYSTGGGLHWFIVAWKIEPTMPSVGSSAF
jgi:hypothetical protein